MEQWGGVVGKHFGLAHPQFGFVMRRNWIAALLFALALSLKALLPAASGAAIIASDATRSGAFAFCQEAPQLGLSSADPAAQRPQSPGHHHQPCPRCALGES